MPANNGLTEIDSYDVTFAGFGGSPIRGWLHLPAHGTGPVAAVVEYLGYGGGRGLAHERVLWAAAGYAHLVMDTRARVPVGLSGRRRTRTTPVTRPIREP